jgi:hypothetical protein
MSNTDIPITVVDPHSGQLSVNPTSVPTFNTTEMGPDDPWCILTITGRFDVGIYYVPEITGLYKFEPWIIYTFGQGDYEYTPDGSVCIKPPFTCKPLS